MTTQDRGGFIFDILAGGKIGNVSASIQRPPPLTTKTRMKALGILGMVFDVIFYGDEITWDQLRAVWLWWGKATLVRFTVPQPGWEYKYDLVGGVFTVTNDIGQIQYRVRTEDISKFGISWDILRSHQFFIHYTAEFDDDAFLIAWKKQRGHNYDEHGHELPTPYDKDFSNLIFEKTYNAFYCDQYYSSDAYHHQRGFFVDVPAVNETFDNKLAQALISAVPEVSILRSLIPARSIKGDYSDVTVIFEDRKIGRAKKLRETELERVLETLLMIHAFASLMNRGKPVYEPWMLWEIWKWVIRGREPVRIRDRAFDLSPNWG